MTNNKDLTLNKGIEFLLDLFKVQSTELNLLGRLVNLRDDVKVKSVNWRGSPGSIGLDYDEGAPDGCKHKFTLPIRVTFNEALDHRALKTLIRKHKLDLPRDTQVEGIGYDEDRKRFNFVSYTPSGKIFNYDVSFSPVKDSQGGEEVR